MAQTPGPKELQQRALQEARLLKNAKKPTTADLRNQIAKVKPMTKRGGKRGR